MVGCARETVVTGFACFGAAIALCIALYFVYLFLEIHVLSGTSLTKYGANKKSRGTGSWALVTGATDGIGREFSVQLAQNGFNIVLVSRTVEKLVALGADIESKYPGTKTAHYAMDFAVATPAQYEELAKLTSHLDVAVLINNVGLSHAMPVPFIEMDPVEMNKIVMVNIVATQHVTRIFAPRLARRKAGLILNLGSFSGQWATPLLTTYAGSKAFLIAWSQALGEELRHENVDVQLLNTFFVVSSMSKVRRPSAMVPMPKSYVRAALQRINRSSGALGRPYTLTPWPVHAYVDWITNYIVPRGFLLRKAYSTSLDTRRRAIRKAERELKAL
ncbi:hypothetical protein MVES1_000508 [Malassezia vespertilionis]|uniref:Very-long-chain 3-oxoacyl-CoA reductase n=1 Tax=Malassezia vespertilionis TaxID=2020962 RepID=A0A2N1JG85_9BASI|nr:uncharacterized protein MVES1_000508 [Malassezia vespertilionis]PKI85564.1 hypothetical protein MVES_000469 [Malassezia vespertilionis]WFD05182.1 hypothetical protein MVES1_000508 [Malassezia vespertilionis]